ncbi:MAG: DUF3189 family protein [bacterium]|jgi:hypothetical protein
MLIFYSSYNHSYAALLAAALHLGWLPSTRPRPEEILALADFARGRVEDFGVPFLKGQDQEGNLVFIVGEGPARHLVERALMSTLILGGTPRSEIHVVRLDPFLGAYSMYGYWLTRLSLSSELGRMLAAHFISIAWPRLVSLVSQVQSYSGLDVPKEDIG